MGMEGHFVILLIIKISGSCRTVLQSHINNVKRNILKINMSMKRSLTLCQPKCTSRKLLISYYLPSNNDNH